MKTSYDPLSWPRVAPVIHDLERVIEHLQGAHTPDDLGTSVSPKHLALLGVSCEAILVERDRLLGERG